MNLKLMSEEIDFAGVAINGVIVFRAAEALTPAVISLNRGKQGHEANTLTKTHHSVLKLSKLH